VYMWGCWWVESWSCCLSHSPRTPCLPPPPTCPPTHPPPHPHICIHINTPSRHTPTPPADTHAHPKQTHMYTPSRHTFTHQCFLISNKNHALKIHTTHPPTPTPPHPHICIHINTHRSATPVDVTQLHAFDHR